MLSDVEKITLHRRDGSTVEVTQAYINEVEWRLGGDPAAMRLGPSETVTRFEVTAIGIEIFKPGHLDLDTQWIEDEEDCEAARKAEKGRK